MAEIEIGIDEDISLGGGLALGGGEVGFSLKKFSRGLKKAARDVGKVSKGVVQNKLFQGAVGVLAVAFPAVGVPAAAAVAAANLALKKVDSGIATAKQVNANLAKLKLSAKAGNPKAAVAVNAMQVALAQRKATKAGAPPPIPVARRGAASFSTTPKPVAGAPTSLYQATPSPAALASTLAAGGTPLGQRTLAAVRAGKSVEVQEGVAVVPGQAPVRGRRVWVGQPPAGTKATQLRGAHAVTRSGLVLSGQAIFVG